MARLGSTHANHARSRDRAYDQAASAIGTTERALRSGRCQAAFHALAEASTAAAEFRVHAREAGAAACAPGTGRSRRPTATRGRGRSAR